MSTFTDGKRITGLSRVSPRGLSFYLSRVDAATTRIQLGQKSITVTVDIDALNQAWFHWNNGQHVQNAFSMLTAAEREFLLTGITPEEWTRIFANSED